MLFKFPCDYYSQVGKLLFLNLKRYVVLCNPFPKSSAEKCNVMLWAKLFRYPHSLLNPSQFNKHS